MHVQAGAHKWWEGALPPHKRVFPMQVFGAGAQGPGDTSPHGVSLENNSQALKLSLGGAEM